MTTTTANPPPTNTSTPNTSATSSRKTNTPTSNNIPGSVPTTVHITPRSNYTSLPSPPLHTTPVSPQLFGNGMSSSPSPIVGALVAVFVAVLVAGLFIFRRKKKTTREKLIGSSSSPRLRHPEDIEALPLPSAAFSLSLTMTDKKIYGIAKEDKHSSADNEISKKAHDLQFDIDDLNHLIRNPHLPIPTFQLYHGPHAVVVETLDGSTPGSPPPQSPHTIREQVAPTETYHDFNRPHGPEETPMDTESELPLEQQFALLMVQQQNLERVRQVQEAELRRVRARLLAKMKDTSEAEGESSGSIQEGWSIAATVSWPWPPGDSQVIEIPEEVGSEEIVVNTRQQGWSTEVAVSRPGQSESRVIEILEEVEGSDDDDAAIEEGWSTETYVPLRRRVGFAPAFPLAYKHVFDKTNN
ncbi:hypothetical protein MVEG_07626 [Podila verticillata NRRL 6337]|nr:hypothetical protein MVEG_07626 [Podila verticillata NRRL 6337]